MTIPVSLGTSVLNSDFHSTTHQQPGPKDELQFSLTYLCFAPWAKFFFLAKWYFKFAISMYINFLDYHSAKRADWRNWNSISRRNVYNFMFCNQNSLQNIDIFGLMQL